MKKSLTLILSFCLLLGTTFAASLDQELSTLTEQILLQSTNKEKTLTDLKEIFTNCAEQHADLQIKSACKTRVDQVLPGLENLYGIKENIELFGNDFSVDMIGKKHGQFLYLLHIPKYNFSYQFALKREISDFKSWEWIKNGDLLIPPYSFGGSNVRKDLPLRISIYKINNLSGSNSHDTISKVYKNVYQDVFQIKDISNYQNLFIKNRKHSNNLPEIRKKYLKEEDSYLIGTGFIPHLPGWSKAIKGNTVQVYGFERLQAVFYCNDRLALAHKLVDTKCNDIINSRPGKIGAIEIIRNSRNPKYIRVLPSGDQYNISNNNHMIIN